MNTLFFVTGNQDKLREVQAIIPAIEGIELDLPEIQELDPHKIIAAKLGEARHTRAGAFIVEDTSLTLDAMNGLPGPLVKWFLRATGVEGIYKLTSACRSARATARTLIGYADEEGALHFFEGVLSGILVPPRGTAGFGWDAIFQPNGWTKTFAEMTPTEKNQCSMRRRALEALREYLLVCSGDDQMFPGKGF